MLAGLLGAVLAGTSNTRRVPKQSVKTRKKRRSKAAKKKKVRRALAKQGRRTARGKK